MTAQQPPRSCDIVIVGAGIVGCLLAYAILKSSPSLNVVLIDDNPKLLPEQLSKSTHPSFDARSIALSAGSCSLLSELGLWENLQKNAQVIGDIDISDRGHWGAATLKAAKSAQAFGYVVELQNIGQAVVAALAQYKQLTRYYDSHLISVDKQLEQVICQLNNKQILTAKLCIAADGSNSITRDLLAIVSQTSDYNACAVIANVSCSIAHNNKAYERFTRSGPIALLPLTDNRYSLVWSVANADLAHLESLNQQDFLQVLQDAFGYRAGVFTSVGKRDVYPLKLIEISKPITHRGVCVGNAAHCLHPVMGQGFNLGLRDVYVLAKVISKVQNKDSIGDYKMLNQYWLARQDDHYKTLHMTDSILRVFSNLNWPIVVGRNIVLQAISIFPSLAESIVKQAKGQFNLFKRDPN